MDPVSALGAASAAVQFLDFAAKLLGGTIKVYKSSSSTGGANKDLKAITQDLQSFSQRVIQPDSSKGTSQRTDSDSPEIEQLCIDCNQVAVELIDAVEKLQKRDGSLWDSFRVALRTIWSEGEINSLQQRVDGYRQQISLHILVHIQHRLDQTVFTDDRIASFESNIKNVLKNQDQRGALWQQNLTKALHSLEPDSFRKGIRARLYFDEIKDREVSILNAYRKTYGWIFNPPSDTNWSDFGEWLAGKEDPLYWITGKPGAGKSTLMKFIYTHPRTRESLEAWGDGKMVSTYSFFFWNSGSELQMSQEGLLRSLLIQIFNELPHLVDIGFQHRLEAWTISPPSDNTWSWTELVEAFNRVLAEITKTRKVALFIDGLDEFDGSHVKLVELIRVILSPNVKACVSSRPWNVFQDAFFREPSLRLEDLTRDDIAFYVSDRLSTHPVFKDIQSVYPQNAASLINSVTDKASGVFLWVFLVVTSLLEGLSDGERVPQLQRRLDALPEDLEELFSKILRTVDDRHYEKAAEYFQIYAAAVEVGESLNVIILSFADNDDPEAAFAPAERMTTSQQDLETKLMIRRLNACTKGLLDSSNYIPTKRIPIVTFLHRTVRDFIYSAKVWASLQKTTGSQFDPKFRLAQALIMAPKSMALGSYSASEFAPQAIHFSVQADPCCKGLQLRLLRELDRAAQSFSSSFTRDYWPTLLNTEMRVCFSFPALLAMCQLTLCLESVLKDPDYKPSQELLDKILRSVLSHFLPSSFSRFCFYSDGPSMEIISLLLKYGANPEAKASEWNDRETIRQRALSLYGENSKHPEIGALFEEQAAAGRTHSRRLKLSNMFHKSS